eukprot:c25504_g1_i1 orf=497-1813(+)
MAEWQQQQIGQVDVVPSETVGSNLTSKRQRRPSVRLGEIGEPPAAILSEASVKRKKSSYQIVRPRQGDMVANSNENVAVDFTFHVKAGRGAKTRPPLYMTRDSGERNLANGIHVGRGQTVHVDNMCSQNVLSGEYRPFMRFPSRTGIGGTKIPQIWKMNGKKARNGKRRRGGLGGLTPVERLRKDIPSIMEIDANENEKVCAVDDTTDPLSDGPYENSSEGCREYDLETSEGVRDTKKRSNLQEAEPPEMNDLPEYQQAYESHLLNKGDAFTSDQENDNDDNIGEDIAGTENNQIGSVSGLPKGLYDSVNDRQQIIPISEGNVKPMPEMKMRPMSETDANLNDREPHSNNGTGQLEHPQLKVARYGDFVNGVKGWLHSLGLGKYTPVFEVHEVDTEVLPLLTLDDLREMGINAVGTRRKMFCAIQNLGKGLVSLPDSL